MRSKATSLKLNIREMTLSAMFAALIAVGAFIRVDIPLPLYTMHFTLQWFFVLMAGFLLGAGGGALSVIVYIAIGLVGFPVFAAGGGPSYILRPGFGFLLGFVPAAYLIGLLSDRLQTGKLLTDSPLAGKLLPDNPLAGRLIAATVGLVVYYGIGAVYFYMIKNLYVGDAVPFSVVVVQYCLITVPADFLLCVLAALLSVRLKPVFSRLL